jgi:uncharacterized PurR-regulated membrane protein YhhQ (DUF165 family)
MKLIFIAFLAAFVAANLIVKHYGAYGLWVSSFTLIPFDFIARSIIHEKLSGRRLLGALFGLTIAAAALTALINWEARRVALASIGGFTAAQITAGVFYQWRKMKQDGFFIKVNGADLVAIVFDSIVFQYIAFAVISWSVTGGQIAIKFLGGLLWYFIIFKLFKYERVLNRR